MAQAGVWGAAESARLVFEKVTGLNTASGSEGGLGVPWEGVYGMVWVVRSSRLRQRAR